MRTLCCMLALGLALAPTAARADDDAAAAGAMRCALRSSSSSRLLGQSSLSSRDRLRSASNRPSVWQVGQ